MISGRIYRYEWGEPYYFVAVIKDELTGKEHKAIITNKQAFIARDRARDLGVNESENGNLLYPIDEHNFAFDGSVYKETKSTIKYKPITFWELNGKQVQAA